MNKTYRETKNELIHCPFNPNHLVKRSRLITHKKTCPDKNIRGIVQCPYNPSHHVLMENLEKHKEKCPDRVVINSDLAAEMEAYIKSIKSAEKKNNINEKPSIKKEKVENDEKVVNKESKENKENDPNLSNVIVGLNQGKKKNNKKKKKKSEEKMIDLENISNKELFNFMFNDKMVIEYDSDFSENNNDCDDDEDTNTEKKMQKIES